MKQILVIKPSSLGDIIHALMVVEALRRERPQLQVDWVARDIFAPFVEACNTVRQTHVFWRKGGLGAFGQLLADIREINYDAVVDMQGLARSGLITWLSGVPRRNCYGRSDAREFSSLACGRRARLPSSVAGGGKQGVVHAVDILREFLPLFGVDAQVPLGRLEFSGVQAGQAAAGALAADRPLILLFPESRRPEKEWAGFPALTDLLLKAPSPSGTAQPLVCWLGSAAVADNGRWGQEHFINLTGRTSIAELPLLVGRAAVVVANDSGPMHLAAAMGKPVVALFGPTDPHKYGPYPLDAPEHCVLRAASGLLADITAEQVRQAVVDSLQQTGAE